MNCLYCKGLMEKKTAPFHIDRKGYHLVLDSVPAWVCSQCGEAYFETNSVEAIQNFMSALDREAQQLPKSA